MPVRRRIDDPELVAFRDEVRAFCERALPPDIRDKVLLNQHLEKQDYVRWQKILHERGWIAGHWPQRYGGQGWTPIQRYIFDLETASCGAPWLTPFGVAYAGPVIYTYGNEEQKRRFLPDILTTDTWWCQGYSEPGAGSDLANLSTRAVRDGDHYVVTGQKIWTTMAHWADMMFALVRTSAEQKRQHGISFLLVDMRSPGVTVRPIVSIDMCHHLNQIFLDEVRVPVANLVGTEGHGWTYAKFLLKNERLLAAEIGRSKRLMMQLRSLLARTFEAGRPLTEDRLWRRRLAELEVDFATLEAVCLDQFAAEDTRPDAGPEASLLKILGSELGQAITTATVDVLARHGLVYQTEALSAEWNGEPVGAAGGSGMIRAHLHERASTIYGGTNEIQRNIIAKSMLGL